ncbi:hypothetical protein KZI27_10670 [Curtobacterium sp. TC1]|uniref:hypothetical protein n=1 Tax=Curtobacterium sp. TC1 TaxID=2862880 RepID=UPI001C9B58DB|nr:hypothetical protein [Curtobacterium sp. TC1]QZQ53831.1 hypothetical protein KZI27_10670 [Curtobacterium sp. TC1]
MIRSRAARRRRAINRYVAGALSIAIAGVTTGALVAVNIAVTGSHAALDGWALPAQSR